MNRKAQLLVLSVLVFGLQNVALASYPADAEASYDLAAMETYADKQAGSSWGVSERRSVQPHDVFPFGGGQIDD